MSSGRIRLFAGESSSIVSFSSGLQGLAGKTEADLAAYLAKSDQSLSPTDVPENLSHLSADTYYEIQPPLSEKQIREFANKCLNLVNTGHNRVQVIDNRSVIPERPLQMAGTVINWID